MTKPECILVMAEQPNAFSYHSIKLYKSESLGCGSYGGVCKAKCDGLLCAAKIMHPTLFDVLDPGMDSYVRKFREECRLLSLARHPNVVQYLGTYTDPDTRLPVLLIELCDESLTSFLERSPQPLSYHVEVNICHDIALGLVYLHSNGLIHRDLTGNNVLMVAGPRAKITDFGMSKLATDNPRGSALTLCPGNVLYMAPEALEEEKKSYTTMLDIFSFGVIVIQILTRQFPKTTDRFREVCNKKGKSELREVVPETERRQAHLNMIPDTYPLKPLAIQCLKKENERPSASQLDESIIELKISTQFMKSVHETQGSSNIQQLEMHFQHHRIMFEEHWKQVSERCDAKDMQLLEMQCLLEWNEGELQRTQQQLQEKEQLLSEFQQSLQQKDETINDLEQTISAHERRIQQLQHQDTTITVQKLDVTAHKTVVATQKDIKKMKWRKGKNAPAEMSRGAAVVHGNTAYFRPRYSGIVYVYKNIIGEETWSILSNNPTSSFGLAIIDGLLTSVGGYYLNTINTLFSLIEEGEVKEWSAIFPPMPTPRDSAACVITEQALIVAGGLGEGNNPLDIVEVMNMATKQWALVAQLPLNCSNISVTIFQDTLYVAGGLQISKSAFACSLPDLWSSSKKVWKEIECLPEERSTLVSFSGHLLAIGGRDDLCKPTTDVYRYDSHTGSWTVACQMKSKRSDCFAVTPLGDYLIVVGGINRPNEESTDSVEILK